MKTVALGSVLVSITFAGCASAKRLANLDARTPSALSSSSPAVAASPVPSAPAPAAAAAPRPAPVAVNVPAETPPSQRYLAGAQEEEWQALIRPHLDALSALHATAEDLTGSSRKTEEWIRIYKDSQTLGNIEAACNTTFGKLESTYRDPYLKPEVVCKVVPRRVELGAKLLRDLADDMVAGALHRFRSDAKNINENPDWITDEDVDGLADIDQRAAQAKADVDPIYAALGQPVPADLLAGVDQIKADLAAAIATSMKNKAISAEHHADRAVDKAVRAKAAGWKYREKAAIRAVRVLSSGWQIVKRSSGLPDYQGKLVQALMQVKGEAFCRLYLLEARQAYAGGGRFQPSISAVVTRGPLIAACK